MTDEMNVEEPLYLATAPYSYASLDPSKDGAWRVLSEQGVPVALVWTDYQDGAGISWVSQSDLVMKVREYISMLKVMGRSASVAYTMVDTIDGTDFGPNQFGKLADAQNLYSKMSEDKQNVDGE